MRFARSFFALAAITAFLPGVAAAATTMRAYVASFGSDTNAASGCDRSAPCRSFAGAMGAVAADGEIFAIDGAGYGPVAIDKNVTIAASPGAHASIASGFDHGITIGAGRTVTLRGLYFNRVGPRGSLAAPPFPFGVTVAGTSTVTIENCVFTNFDDGAAVHVENGASAHVFGSLFAFNRIAVWGVSAGNVSVVRSRLLDSSQAGFSLENFTDGTTSRGAVVESVIAGRQTTVGVTAYSSSATAYTRVLVDRSTVSHSTWGLIVASPAAPSVTVTLSNSMIVNHAVGIENGGQGTIETYGNNIFSGNDEDTRGSLTPVTPF